MAYGSANVTGASSQDVKAVDTKAQEIIDKVGDTGDTGGSSTDGTVFGKLNKIISDLASHISAWTSARAGHIDTIKASTDKIGATGDTGGSSSAGTVFGKLNKIISDLATHMGRWTSTRAGYIDTINTNASAIKTKTDTIGTTGDTGGSAKAGTIMGKLNKLISDLSTHISAWTSTRAGYIDTINTNASAIKTKTDTIGTTGDTGGSATAGTVFGKLNKLISDLASHISFWTSTRAEAIDTVKTDTDEIKAILSADDALARKFGSAIEWGSATVSRDEETVINGKGVVFLYKSVSSNEPEVSVKVDGVSICTNNKLKSIVETIEFNQSFSIITVSSEHYGIICDYILY